MICTCKTWNSYVLFRLFSDTRVRRIQDLRLFYFILQNPPLTTRNHSSGRTDLISFRPPSITPFPVFLSNPTPYVQWIQNIQNSWNLKKVYCTFQWPPKTRLITGTRLYVKLSSETTD